MNEKTGCLVALQDVYKRNGRDPACGQIRPHEPERLGADLPNPGQCAAHRCPPLMKGLVLLFEPDADQVDDVTALMGQMDHVEADLFV